MAFIGMRHLVAAPLTSHTDGTEPTYSKGLILGKAISGNLTITRNNNPLYADDVIAEDDNGVTAMSLEVGMDDLLEDAEVAVIGVKEKPGEDPAKEYITTDAAAPYVGTGYIRVRRKNNETKYQAVWYYKAMYSIDSENSQTKGESIEWQTPTLTARAMALDVDGSGARAFRKKAVFDEESKAVAWLDKLASIGGD